jgi:ribosomal protein S18 acetylase RimI-like enzyme
MIYKIVDNSKQYELKQLGLKAWKQFETVLTPDNWMKLQTTLNSDDTYHQLLNVSTCFVCELNEEIIGMAFIVLSGNPTEIFQSNWSYIRFVSVHPNHSGKGIGKYLTQLCIDFAKQNKEQTVVLHTSEFMNKARHIYESLGFTILKELEPRLGKKYWLYTLTL